MKLEESAAGFETSLAIARLPAAAFQLWIPLIFIWPLINTWTVTGALFYSILYVYMDKKGVTPKSLFIRSVRSAYGSKWHNTPLDVEE